MMKLKTVNKEIELVDIWYKYLYPYFIRFFKKNELSTEWKNDIIFIPKETQKDFNQMLKSILEELLIDCYRESTHKKEVNTLQDMRK